jgi:hypothetical protein
MLGVSHTARVVWRRRHASRHYVGYVLVGDAAVRLAGTEQDSGIYAVLSIPHASIVEARVGRGFDEEVVGEPAVVLELPDDDPIYVRPVTTGPLGLGDLARRLSSAGSPAVSARDRKTCV